MDNAPAHAGFIPHPLRFQTVGDDWSQRIARASGAQRVERALHPRPAPLGYYRLTPAADDTPIFGKVVGPAEARRIEAATHLTDALTALGVPSPRSLGAADLGDDYHLFMYPWIAGAFATGAAIEMRSLGEAVAGLHDAFRRLPQPPPSDQIAGSTVRWRNLESLRKSARLDGSTEHILAEFLARRIEIDAQLMAAAQPIHNDLHAGNVFFDKRGGVVAFLDFEEALHSVGCPLIDLSWVIERFCFFGSHPTNAERLATDFLSAYLDTAKRFPVRPGAVLDSMRWRSLSALAILDRANMRGSTAWRTEWSKFVAILSTTSQCSGSLSRIEAQLLL